MTTGGSNRMTNLVLAFILHKQGIQSGGSIHGINLLTLIRSVYSQCHVDSLVYIEENVNSQTLTQVSQLYVHVSFYLRGKQVMTKSAHWWSWSCDLHV